MRGMMILASGVRLRPLPEPKTLTLSGSLQHYAPAILACTVLLGVALLCEERLEESDRKGRAFRMAKAFRAGTVVLLVSVVVLAAGRPTVENIIDRFGTPSPQATAEAVNVAAVKEHYRLDDLTGWKGLPVEGGYRVVWLRADRSGTGTLWVHDDGAVLYDDATGRELGCVE